MKVEDMSNDELNTEFNRLADIYETERDSEIDDPHWRKVREELSNRICMGTFPARQVAQCL